MRLPLADQRHEQFWRQLLHGLAAPAPTQMSLQAERASTRTTAACGSMPRCWTRRSSRRRTSRSKSTPTAEDGSSAATTVEPSGRDDGRYAVRVQARAAGLYRVELVARQGDKELARRVSHLRRDDGVREQFAAWQHRALLERIAKDTGGRYWQLSDLERVAGGDPLLAGRHGGTTDHGPVEHPAGVPAARAAEDGRVAVATALEAAVKRVRRLRRWPVRSAWRPRLPRMAATQVVVIGGLGGEAGIRGAIRGVEREDGATLRRPRRAARKACIGCRAPRRRARRSRRGCARPRARCAKATSSCSCCSGTAVTTAANIASTFAGPDVTGTQILSWLDRIPQTVQQLVINATSASGAIAERWTRPYRVVITATRSAGERNATRFGGFWAEALTERRGRSRQGRQHHRAGSLRLRQPQGDGCLQVRCRHRDGTCAHLRARARRASWWRGSAPPHCSPAMRS